jgi:thiol-disulfide isomerase/thioredoxin
MNPQPQPEHEGPAAPPAATPGHQRRRALLLGAGATAALAGLGAALWQDRRARPAAPHADSAWLWDMSFPRPAGGELLMASLRGRPLVLNFWATWCPPCIQEMPEFDRFHREFSGRGWQVLGLAVDSPGPVRDFLGRTPVGYAIGLAGFEGTEVSKRLGNAQGALPFTALLDAGGRVLQRRLGQTHFQELAAWAAQA